MATTDNQFKQWHFNVTSALADCESEPVLSINFGAVPAIINKLNASGIESKAHHAQLFMSKLTKS